MTRLPEDAAAPIVRLTDGLWFQSGPDAWAVPPLRLAPGEWAVLIPAGETAPVVDPSGSLARSLATLAAPTRGTLELLGRNVYDMPYLDLQRLRARLGFVQGYGGLLSNRTLRENIALPLSVHGGRSFAEEVEVIDRMIDGFALRPVADLRPSDVDGATRWRTCVARALVLDPSWIVLEGLGDWELDRGRGVVWSHLREHHVRRTSATVICLSRQNPAFEAWFQDEGGITVRFQHLQAEAFSRRPGQ